MTQQTSSLPESSCHESSTDSSQKQQDTTPETSSKQQTTDSITLRAPRSVWWEFFLHFITFGVYTNFWLVARVKEIKQLSGQPLKPWLWIVVPNLVFLQPFAFPKLNKILRQVESEAGIRYPDSHSNLWLVAVFIVSAFFWFTAKYATPAWGTLVALIVWSGLFSVFHQRFNILKQRLDHVSFKGKSSGYAVWEWLILILYTPIIAFMLLYSSIFPFTLNEIKALPDQFTYTAPHDGYQLTVHGDGWREVEVGSFSDGSAEFELAGNTDNAFFLVFNNSTPVTVNEVIDARVAAITLEYPGIECQEKRSLAKEKLIVIAHVTCEGEYILDPVLQTITVFKNGNEVYELLGTLIAPELSFPKLSSEFQQMAKEFKPL